MNTIYTVKSRYDFDVNILNNQIAERRLQVKGIVAQQVQFIQQLGSGGNVIRKKCETDFFSLGSEVKSFPQLVN